MPFSNYLNDYMIPFHNGIAYVLSIKSKQEFVVSIFFNHVTVSWRKMVYFCG